MIYLELFWEFFQVGLFSIGGGYAALPLIQHSVVDTRGWMTLVEFTDLLTISQMTPGPIGINAATFVGTRTAGIMGAVLATAGCVTPSFIIVLTLAYFYTKYRNLTMVRGVLEGLRPAVVGLIAASGVAIALSCFRAEEGTWLAFRGGDALALVLFPAGFAVLRKWRANPIFVILLSGAAGLAVYLIVTIF